MKTIKILFLVYIVSFLLNFIWENIHYLLYTHYEGGEITRFILFRASLADALILTVLAVPLLFIWYFKRNIWLIIPVGLILAILIEMNALMVGRWAYNEYMPIIPFLNVGLTPTIQLALTGYLTYYFISRRMNVSHS